MLAILFKTTARNGFPVAIGPYNDCHDDCTTANTFWQNVKVNRAGWNVTESKVEIFRMFCLLHRTRMTGLTRLIRRSSSSKSQVEYQQGQSPEPKVREYFYYIDHEGMVRQYPFLFTLSQSHHLIWSTDCSYFWTMRASKISHHALRTSDSFSSFSNDWNSTRPIATRAISRICRCVAANEILFDAMTCRLFIRKHCRTQVRFAVMFPNLPKLWQLSFNCSQIHSHTRYRTHMQAVVWCCPLNRTKYTWHRRLAESIIQA